MLKSFRIKIQVTMHKLQVTEKGLLNDYGCFPESHKGVRLPAGLALRADAGALWRRPEAATRRRSR